MYPGGSEWKKKASDVRRLLRANREVQRLKRKHPAIEELLCCSQHLGRERHFPHAPRRLPGIHDAMPVVAFDAPDVLRVDDTVPDDLRAGIECIVVHVLRIRRHLVDQLRPAWIVEDHETIARETLALRLAQNFPCRGGNSHPDRSRNLQGRCS